LSSALELAQAAKDQSTSFFGLVGTGDGVYLYDTIPDTYGRVGAKASVSAGSWLKLSRPIVYRSTGPVTHKWYTVHALGKNTGDYVQYVIRDKTEGGENTFAFFDERGIDPEGDQ
jgi:hypothetical protein